MHENCPVCGSSDIQAFLKVDDHSISKEVFALAQCQACGMVFTQNPPKESDAGPYYQSADYISHSDTKKGLINRVYHAVRKFMLGRKYRLIRSLGSGKRLLDIGTGTGHFLHYMAKKNYKTVGIEISEDTRNQAIKNFGLNIHSPEVLLSKGIQEKFDFVTLWHVLEHIYPLHESLRAIYDLLDSEGKLILALPNYMSFDAQYYHAFWAGYDVPRHIWHFCPESVIVLAQKYGFRVKKMDLLPFDSFYVSMLSEKYKGSSLGLAKGFCIGALSFARSVFKPEKASSVVYILEKAN
ncbi:class I SAM-dependent methyltransferase [Marinilongibacter aquaticus]|uniref:class I SAM-dependent methyltransferase n=1 Tax=Marinilongibacter aquaticus TaxID=2975157 RepID=UPI0021BDDD69|nr:class I SAM-dependent methyltransferase [Marinilongibacter aquaticus]UBM59010.1 class I SAM-dependent methyltransferase [Marinilongibacter aquaticus]